MPNSLIVTKVLQRYWRLSRGLTLGAQAVVIDAQDRVLLIRHTYQAGWRFPGGGVEHHETAEAALTRELEEEAGAKAGRLDRLTTIFTTPGFIDERIHLFAAHDLVPIPHRREPDEFMETVPMPLSRALGLIRDGAMVDGKSIIAVLFFAAFRSRV